MAVRAQIEPQSQLAATTARLRRAKQRRKQFTKKEQDIDNELERIERRKRELKTMRLLNQGQCWDYMDSVYKKSIIPYAKAWNLDFAEKIQSKLPRELRNMVYEYLLDATTMYRYDEAIGGLIDSSCKCDADGYICCCLENASLPHFLRPAYVGQYTGSEIVEMVYEKYQQECPINVWGPENLRRALYGDNFKVNFNPFSKIRRLVVLCSLDHYRKPRIAYPSEIWNTGSPLVVQRNRGVPQLQAFFNDLLPVRGNKGFDLLVKFEQRNLRLSVLEEGLAAFKKVYGAFLKAGAKVDVWWSYMPSYDPVRNPRCQQPFPMYLQDYFVTTSRTEWRAKVLASWLRSYSAGKLLERNARFLNETAEAPDDAKAEENSWDSDESDVSLYDDDESDESSSDSEGDSDTDL